MGEKRDGHSERTRQARVIVHDNQQGAIQKIRWAQNNKENFFVWHRSGRSASMYLRVSTSFQISGKAGV